MARIGGDDRAREHRVFAAFDTAVGAALRKQTEPETLKGTTLFVRVTSSAMAHHVTLLKGEILTQLTRVLGNGIVNDLRTRVGPLKADARTTRQP